MCTQTQLVFCQKAGVSLSHQLGKLKKRCQQRLNVMCDSFHNQPVAEESTRGMLK